MYHMRVYSAVKSPVQTQLKFGTDRKQGRLKMWVHSDICETSETNEEVKQSKPSESSEPIGRSYKSAIGDPVF